MSALACARAINAIVATNDPEGLTALAQTLRRAHPGGPEPDIVARLAELKRQRIVHTC
jgi:hypothetical protein